VRTGVKRFGLFHHDPENSDTVIDNIVSRLRSLLEEKGEDMHLFAASEGREIVL